MKSIDAYFAKNTAGVSGVEFFWGLAIPVVLESTFLQIFLSRLGASNVYVGLVPAIISIFLALFSPAASLLTSHMKRKKKAVILLHVMTSFPVIVYGILLLCGSRFSGLVSFFVLYCFFAAFIGATVPAWQNFLVKIFSERKSMKALSVMFIFQTVGRIIGGFLIAGAIEKYALNTKSAALVFLGSGILFFLGSFCFLFVKEEEVSVLRQKRHSAGSFFLAVKEIFKNRNFIFFALSGMETTVIITIISFFAKYAVEIKGIKDSFGAGLFGAAIYSGAVLANVVFGWFDVLETKHKMYFSKISGILSVFMIMFSGTSSAFLLSSFVLGVSRGVSMLTFMPSVKKITGEEDSTDYFSAFPIILLPFSVGIPWLSGLFIDILGADQKAYFIVFAALSSMIFLSGVFLYPVVFGKDRNIRLAKKRESC